MRFEQGEKTKNNIRKNNHIIGITFAPEIILTINSNN